MTVRRWARCWDTVTEDVEETVGVRVVVVQYLGGEVLHTVRIMGEAEDDDDGWLPSSLP